MNASNIAPEVRDVLREHVNTYERLHVLLLLRRRAVALALDEVANTLALDERVTREVLAELVSARLVVEDPRDRYRYCPSVAAQGAAVDGLARLFEDDPVRIVQWMSRNAFDRLHHSAASAFAEAVLTEKKNRDGSAQ